MKPLLEDITELKIPGHLLHIRYMHAESVEDITELKIPGHLLHIRHTHAESVEDTTELKIPGHLLHIRYTKTETMGTHLKFALLQLQATAVGQTCAIQLASFLGSLLHFYFSSG